MDWFDLLSLAIILASGVCLIVFGILRYAAAENANRLAAAGPNMLSLRASKRVASYKRWMWGMLVLVLILCAIWIIRHGL